MTTLDDQVRTPPPPRPRKPPPSPRRRARVVPDDHQDVVDVAVLAQEPTNRDVLNAISGLVSRVDRLERGSVRYIETEPEPKADARAVNPEALDPFTKRLWEDRTHDTPENYGGDREPSYNIPLRLYLKNDGTYAWLQGDAKSRAYYSDKGFYCCSPEEVAEYEKIKPSLVAHQREKAHLITAIRRLIDTDSALVGHRGDADADNELGLMSVEQLHQAWKSLTAETSQPTRPLPAMKRWRSEGRDKMLDGIETTPPRSDLSVLDELERSTPRRSRQIEVTAANARLFR